MNKHKRILIVEDDRAVARGLKDLLETDGYSARTVFDGPAAIREATLRPTDLIMLDIHLPRLSGLEVCRQMRQRGFTHPIIMLTARGEQIDKVVGLEAGADDYVTKPFDAHELLARVHAHMRMHERLPSGKAASSSTPTQRRLLSVMFTDMRGFARAMNTDEALALALLRKHNSIISRAVKRHDGRVVEVIGDAFMVSFESALKAVQCGTAILDSFRTLNTKRPRKEQLHVRIGIHLGDVMEDNGKLRGDTVNIAARLQQLASPDHINASESVHEAIRGRLNVKSVRIGKKHFKNIRQPIGVYRITIPPTDRESS